MNIFVGASSRNTENPLYLQAAKEVGTLIAQNHHNLIFGGCENGLMGIVYFTVLSERECTSKDDSAIIVTQAEAYKDQIEPLTIDEFNLSKTINERKNAFLKLADCLVLLPGGIGTIDEFITSLEAKRAGEHDNPIILVNLNNYFTPMLEMLNKTCEEHFASPENLELFDVVESIEEMKAMLQKYGC